MGPEWMKSSRSLDNGTCVEARWRRSTYCDAGNCVEVAADDEVLMRDSKDPTGPVLTFGAPAWRAFLAELRAGPPQ